MRDMALEDITAVQPCSTGDEFGVGPYKTIARCDGFAYWVDNGIQAHIAPASEGDLMLRVMLLNIQKNKERLQAYQARFKYHAGK